MSDRPTRRFTLLGSGSSGGVPRADGEWGACDPAEPRNRRSRCSLLVQQWRGPAGDPQAATTFVIDTSPDLRTQALAVGLRRLDAVVFSHDHADQAHGIDDVRAFALIQRRRIPTFLDGLTRQTLTRRFSYCFAGEGGYPAILDAQPDIVPGVPFDVHGPGGPVTTLPILQDHGGTHSIGFRIGAFAYSNDVVELDAAAFDALAGVSVWVVDALRDKPHPTHAHLAKALAWIDRIGPARAILTNMHIDLDYGRLHRELPPPTEPGYDGLVIEMAHESSIDCP